MVVLLPLSVLAPAHAQDAGAPPGSQRSEGEHNVDGVDARTTPSGLAPMPARTADPTPPPAGATAPAPVEVTVRGPSVAERLRQSAQAVKIIETKETKRQAADMGEVLARTEGVSVQRSGGLGSSTRLSLNGLTDDQIRFFLDGVPLDLAGYPLGIANVPVNLIERVEIYRGVVPVRFGADALGGAVNLVTDENVRGTHGAVSYQIGSFHTHRLTLSARHLQKPSGFFARVNGSFDYARNNYPIDVEVPDARGRLVPARVDRFHDAYRASHGDVEVGFVNRPWARRLLLRAFISDYDKDLQHNIVMTVPYGEVTYRETTTGATLRYDKALGHGLSFDAIGGYTYGRSTFLDVSKCIYDWFGRCIRERDPPGEIQAGPRDQVFWEHSGFGRLNLSWLVQPEHMLRLSVSPTFVTRTGEDRRIEGSQSRDPLAAERDLFTLVSGVEYKLNPLDNRLENILFAKDYAQLARTEEPLLVPAGQFRRHDRDVHRVGVGDSLRYTFSEWLYAKASYEWATRLPRPDEVFGDAALIAANLDLLPETSHNANLGATIDARGTAVGAFRLDANGFLRDANQLIVLLGNDRVFTYQNVFGGRSLGVESAAGWTSPGEYVALDANITYQDFRNTSHEGTFGKFAGDRIPNRPWLFANGAARAQLKGVFAPRDEIALTVSTRYVHEFFRGWESLGLRDSKQAIPSQLVHSLVLTYLVRGPRVTVSSTAELHNLTDERVFDFFGVQRPGRALFFKTTLEMDQQEENR